jgi:hypothetical protein
LPEKFAAIWEYRCRKQLFPAEFSRIVIPLAKGRRAKPNANTRKLSPTGWVIELGLEAGKTV